MRAGFVGFRFVRGEVGRCGVFFVRRDSYVRDSSGRVFCGLSGVVRFLFVSCVSFRDGFVFFVFFFVVG